MNIIGRRSQAYVSKIPVRALHKHGLKTIRQPSAVPQRLVSSGVFRIPVLRASPGLRTSSGANRHGGSMFTSVPERNTMLIPVTQRSHRQPLPQEKTSTTSGHNPSLTTVIPGSALATTPHRSSMRQSPRSVAVTPQPDPDRPITRPQQSLPSARKERR
ncbi:hypothetical protein SERLADRAFT_432670 [Serpula lacrymans var. lacrymans S7.9]|uniref:Uncharacterized protein n=1 Tax=Serpula lacrymans var. lacrymans (strain S7.9) TaxID=578457 RepID=F8NG42_SERL9|nr:uncharacterized protein SERLADRAFT_432670 [Serpula lacrymans var. lacrymans S7.9]EGO31012.1 hypothetical protein SERLADRAFT_432670 [Serpula lacrymans var. lacrymans S7.9]